MREWCAKGSLNWFRLIYYNIRLHLGQGCLRQARQKADESKDDESFVDLVMLQGHCAC